MRGNNTSVKRTDQAVLYKLYKKLWVGRMSVMTSFPQLENCRQIIYMIGKEKKSIPAMCRQIIYDC